jgi:hypothetical protein
MRAAAITDPVIFASAVLAMPGFSNLLDGVPALRAYGSRANLATTAALGIPVPP